MAAWSGGWSILTSRSSFKPRAGKSEYPRLSLYRNSGFLIHYRFTEESTRSDRATQQADRPQFLRD